VWCFKEHIQQVNCPFRSEVKSPNQQMSSAASRRSSAALLWVDIVFTMCFAGENFEGQLCNFTVQPLLQQEWADSSQNIYTTDTTSRFGRSILASIGSIPVSVSLCWTHFREELSLQKMLCCCEHKQVPHSLLLHRCCDVVRIQTWTTHKNVMEPLGGSPGRARIIYPVLILSLLQLSCLSLSLTDPVA